MQTYIDSPSLTISALFEAIQQKHTFVLSPEAQHRVQACREYLDAQMATGEKVIYGINTGFGSLCNTVISPSSLAQLQVNLMESHACGTGPEAPKEIVKLMLLSKARSLAYGHSGVQVNTLTRLLDFYNHDITPVVYTQGSLGASGDLAPLAHLCLPIIGKGEVYWKGEKHPAAEVLAAHNWQPIELQSKEGLALLNGTQFMLAYGLHLIYTAEKLWALANEIAAMSLDAFDGRIEPFHPALHAIRPHSGQVKTAAMMRELLEGSQILSQPKKHVQDPYSFRCIPQVHGASYDAIQYVKSVFETEFHATTDNPNIFPNEDLILSGGNFHGQPLAISLDFLSIAVAELGAISERRTYQLIAGLRDLPAFLTPNPGLNSGFMIPQYTAASIASQNKQLCTPASIDTIPSSHNQEDHVSMGANAATKSYIITENVKTLLAIELLNASQALDLRKPLMSSEKICSMHNEFRMNVAYIENDTLLYKLIHTAVDFINTKIMKF